MRKLNLDTLLKKKRVKGEELGRAIVMNLVHDLKHGPNQPLFSQDDLQRMQSSLEDSHEIEVYGMYVDLYNGIMLQHWRAQASKQQAYHGYYKFFFLLMTELSAQMTQQRLLSLPVIATQRQYNETLMRQMAQKQAIGENFKGLILRALNYYLGQYTTTSMMIPTDIEIALQALKEKPFRNQHILGLINEEHEIGYYLFPGGKRSDQLTEKQCLAELTTLEPFQSMPEIAKLWDKSRSPDSNKFEITRIFGIDKVRRFESQQAELDTGEDEAIWPKWVLKEDSPLGLTCWDVLVGDYSMKGTYFGILQKYKDQEAVLFKEFLEDFPDLYRALKEDVIQQTGWKYLESITARDFIKRITTWGELANIGVYSYQEINKPGRFYDWDEDCLRLIREGMVALKGDDGEQPYNEVVDSLTGEEIITDGKECESLTLSREALIIPALNELGAYSALLPILGEQYGVPELAEIKPDVSVMGNHLEFLNYFIQCFFKGLVPLIDPQADPSENTIKEVKTYLERNYNTVRLSDLGELAGMLLGAKK